MFYSVAIYRVIDVAQKNTKNWKHLLFPYIVQVSVVNLDMSDSR